MAITNAQQYRQMLKDGKVAMQGGGPNYLGKQPEVTVPKKWKSSPDHPDTELAYITEPEKKVLIALNMHGGLEDGKPNKGPKGVMSLQGDMGSVQSDGKGGYTGTGGGGDGPELPPAVKAAVAQGKPTSVVTKKDEKRARDEVKKFLKSKGIKTGGGNVLDIFNPFSKNRRKLSYNASMLIPGQRERSAKMQRAYKEYLESMGITPPDTLTGEDEDLADFFVNNAFDRTSPSYKDPITDEVKSIQNYGDFIAENFGAPSVKYSGNVGGLETFVKTRDADGKPLTYGFRETRGGGRDDSILPISQPVVSIPEPTGYVNPLSLLTPRIAGTRFLGTEFEDDTEFAADGGRIGAMGGGIMNVEDLDREAFLLGGIAKGLKKAVRGVKKIIKSPLGKAALIGAGFGLAGMGPFKGLANTGFGKGLAGLRGTLLGQAGSRVGEAFIPYKEGLLTKLGLTKGGGSFMPTFKGGITLASILPLLAGKTDEEKDDILKDYYASQKLIPSTTSRQAGSEFDFYEYNLAEGGMPSKEPVAKKVMPLLDMDGMEKDYRAEGGFVPIGRMEKADDVPARLSKNEFVFTADAVRNAGEGDVDKGAEVMYNMMKNLEAGGEVSEESQGLDGAREMFQTSQRLGEVI